MSSSSSPAPSVSPLAEAGFSRLSDTVFLFDPSKSSPSSPSASTLTTATDVTTLSSTFEKVVNPKHPSTILLFSWMGAASRHIVKYSSMHRQLFPNSKILLVRTDPKDFRRSKPDLHACLKPAADTLRSDEDSKNTFVHAFSNGGLFSFVHLLDVYGSVIPHKSIMIDSAPGGGMFVRDFFGAIRAFSAGFPKNPFVKRPLQFLLSVYMLLYYLANFILRRENPIAWGRRRMNEKELVATAERRTYIYSKSDKVIRWTEVESHADEAAVIAKEQAGGKTIVEKVLFEDSEHVGHYRRHPAEYIEAVKRCVGIE